MMCFRKARNVLLALFFMATCAMPAMASTDPEVLLAQIRSLPGVSSAVQASSAIPGTLFYRVTFTQPLDHQLPSGPTFQQRVTLLHRDQTAPVLAWYEARGGVRRIPAVGTVDEIAARVRRALGV